MGCGRTTSFCTSCTRLFRLINTQSKALRAPPVHCSFAAPLFISLSVYYEEIYLRPPSCQASILQLDHQNCTCRTNKEVFLEEYHYAKLSDRVCRAFHMSKLARSKFCSSPYFLNRILSRKFLTDQTPNLQIIPAITLFCKKIQEFFAGKLFTKWPRRSHYSLTWSMRKGSLGTWET